MEVIGHDHKCMQQEHRPAAEPCDQIEGLRDARRSLRSRKTYGLIAELGAFSPGLKPGHGRIKRSRGFENPLPRTESPGLAQSPTPLPGSEHVQLHFPALTCPATRCSVPAGLELAVVEVV